MSLIKDEVRRLEADLDLVLEHARACVARLRTTDDDDLRFLIAERRPRLGSMALKELGAAGGDRPVDLRPKQQTAPSAANNAARQP